MKLPWKTGNGTRPGSANEIVKLEELPEVLPAADAGSRSIWCGTPDILSQNIAPSAATTTPKTPPRRGAAGGYKESVVRFPWNRATNQKHIHETSCCVHVRHLYAQHVPKIICELVSIIWSAAVLQIQSSKNDFGGSCTWRHLFSGNGKWKLQIISPKWRRIIKGIFPGVLLIICTIKFAHKWQKGLDIFLMCFLWFP